MVSILEGLSVTRVVGLAAYATSLSLCAGRLWKSRTDSRTGKVFGVLTILQLALLLDIAFDWRWKLHAFFMGQATAHGVYELRRSPQLLALWVLAGISAFCCVSIASKFRHRSGAAIAVTGTMLSIMLRGAELLSYHNLDAVLYRSIWKIMLVGVLWLGLTAFTCLGVWIDSRNYSKR
jgi:hypothetical protein